MLHTEAIPLNRLKPGQSGLVSRVDGPPDHVHRLEEFGICRGARVQMFRAGSACIVRMAGNKVCIRADGLLQVFVNRLSVKPNGAPLGG